MVLEPANDAKPPAADVVWHDLECGSYSADLPLWLALAREHPDGAILDIGAGTGRVALELARHGRRVIALDHDRELLAALAARVDDLDIQSICADARSFQIPRAERVALCIAPTQVVQLLGGAAGRSAFLRCGRAHLPPGGLLACSLVAEFEPFDCTAGGLGPTPETCRIDGALYTSQATRVEAHEHTIAIERHRHISHGNDIERDLIERDLIELDRLSITQLEREAQAIGLHPEPARNIAATDDHAASDVVMLRA